MKRHRFKSLLAFGLVMSVVACSDDYLKEVPVGSLSADNVFSSVTGFEGALVSLHEHSRDELAGDDLYRYFDMNTGTDIATGAQQFEDYETYLTQFTPASERTWDWVYSSLLRTSNFIIANAERADLAHIWANEEQKNAIIAEAKFFRAYGHNILATLYGGVPIISEVYSAPKTDFIRSSRQQVYEFVADDLEFASAWLPLTVSAANEGRIVKAAADHLLAEVYISLGRYDDAVQAASNVINSGLYRLMSERFGVNKDKPGDVFADLFAEGNLNRSSGNLESIYVWQYEERTPGGQGTRGGNQLVRGWLPFIQQLRDPSGSSGMVLADTVHRGVGAIRPSTYFLYDLWRDNWDNDIRNSQYNIRRTYYYNNPASSYFGQVANFYVPSDTMQVIYPGLIKVEGKPFFGDVGSGRTAKDFIVYRLAETYLLRAEAYLRKGDLDNAALDINTVRMRANAKPINASDVDIDYILDERARELIAEEPRRRTLMRMGMLVERVKKYNMKEKTRNSITEKHNLYPIPQKAIDANFSATLEQNPGYN